MRIVIEAWVLGIAFAITPYWTKWYLPINISLVRYLTSGELTISILWLIHFSVRFPLFRINKQEAEQYMNLPRRTR